MDEYFTLFLKQRKEISEKLRKLLPAGIQKYQRGTLLTFPGMKIALPCWLVVEGVAKYYYHDNFGRPVVTAFWSSGDVITTPSLTMGKAPEGFTELVSECRLMAFDPSAVQDMETGGDDEPLTLQIERQDSLKNFLYQYILRLNAQEKLGMFTQLHPPFLISRKDLASFLGLDISTLGRILSK